MPRLIFILLAGFLFPILAIPQRTVTVVGDFTFENGCDGAEYFEDKSAQQSIHDALKTPAESWIKNKGKNITGEVCSSNFWTKFTLTNSTAIPQHLSLVVTKPLLDRVRFFCVENRTVRDSSMLMGDAFPFSAREVFHRYFIHHIELPPNESWEVYCMAGKTGGKFSFIVEVHHQDYLLDYLNRDIFKKTLLMGIVIIIGLASLFYYLFSFEKAALAFFLQNLCGTLFLLSNDSLGFQYIWPNSVNVQLAASLFFTSTYILFQAIFIVFFFRIPAKSITHRILLSAIAIQGLATASFFLPYFLKDAVFIEVIKPLGYWITSATLLTNVAIVIACFIYYFQKKDRNMRLFILSIFVPLFVGMLTLVEWMTLLKIPKLTLFEIMAISGSIQNVIVLFIAVRIFSEKEKSEKNLLKALVVQQNEALQNLLKGQQDERQRLSRELHDGLSVRIAHFKSFLKKLDNDEANAPSQKVNELADEIDEIHQDLRNFSHALNPIVLQKLGLKKAIEDLIYKIEMDEPDMDIQFHFPSDFFISKKHERHLFHITQELLNNTLKHAKATQISIRFQIIKDQHSLEYRDNGIGFDPTALESTGIGLRNIESRAQLMRGRLSVQRISPIGMKHIVTFSV